MSMFGQKIPLKRINLSMWTHHLKFWILTYSQGFIINFDFLPDSWPAPYHVVACDSLVAPPRMTPHRYLTYLATWQPHHLPHKLPPDCHLSGTLQLTCQLIHRCFAKGNFRAPSHSESTTIVWSSSTCMIFNLPFLHVLFTSSQWLIGMHLHFATQQQLLIIYNLHAL